MPSNVTVTLIRRQDLRTLDGDTEPIPPAKLGPYQALLYRRNPGFKRMEDGPGQDTLTNLVLSLPPNATPLKSDQVHLPACAATGGVAIMAQIQLVRGYEGMSIQCDLELGASQDEWTSTTSGVQNSQENPQ